MFIFDCSEPGFHPNRFELDRSYHPYFYSWYQSRLVSRAHYKNKYSDLGAVDSSGQTLILNLFNSDQSPIFIAFFHFIWNIGGVLALILLSGLVEPEVEQPCPNIENNTNSTNITSRTIENSEFNNLTFLYWSFAGVTIPIVIYIYYLYASDHTEKIKALNGIADSSDPENVSFAYKEKFRRVRGYAVVLVMFMFGFGLKYCFFLLWVAPLRKYKTKNSYNIDTAKLLCIDLWIYSLFEHFRDWIFKSSLAHFNLLDNKYTWTSLFYSVGQTDFNWNQSNNFLCIGGVGNDPNGRLCLETNSLFRHVSYLNRIIVADPTYIYLHGIRSGYQHVLYCKVLASKVRNKPIVNYVHWHRASFSIKNNLKSLQCRKWIHVAILHWFTIVANV